MARPSALTITPSAPIRRRRISPASARTVLSRHISPFAPPEKEIVASLVMALTAADLEAAAADELERVALSAAHGADSGTAAGFSLDEIYLSARPTSARLTASAGTRGATNHRVPTKRVHSDEDDEEESLERTSTSCARSASSVAVPVRQEAAEEPEEIPPNSMTRPTTRPMKHPDSARVERAASDAAERARREAARAHWDALIAEIEAAPFFFDERVAVPAGQSAAVVTGFARDGATIKVSVAPADERSRFQQFVATHRARARSR